MCLRRLSQPQTVGPRQSLKSFSPDLHGHVTKRGRISSIPTMAHAHTFGTSRLPVISDQPAPYVIEQVDTYFRALVLAGLLGMSGLQYEIRIRRVF